MTYVGPTIYLFRSQVDRGFDVAVFCPNNLTYMVENNYAPTDL